MNKKILIRLSGIVILVFTCCVPVRVAIAREENLQKRIRFMMDTYVTIYAGGPEETASRAMDLAFDRMQEIDTKFNILNPKSPLYAFNHKGVPISDEEILNVVRVALEISQKSDGAFDITVCPLIKLWGFYGDSPHLPREKQIKDCLRKIDYRYIVIRNGEVQTIKENTNIDLGAIAKGYAVSEAVKVLKEEGVTSALIDAGGDVYALGRKNSKMWKVGVRSPRGEDLLGYLEVEDLAVMGSGDYERFFMKDGKRYHHIFNPKTGYPAEGLSGVTVICPDIMMADAWATALFVVAPKKGLAIVEEIPGMETLMVTVSGEILYSSGLKNALKVVPKAK